MDRGTRETMNRRFHLRVPQKSIPRQHAEKANTGAHVPLATGLGQTSDPRSAAIHKTLSLRSCLSAGDGDLSSIQQDSACGENTPGAQDFRRRVGRLDAYANRAHVEKGLLREVRSGRFPALTS